MLQGYTITPLGQQNMSPISPNMSIGMAQSNPLSPCCYQQQHNQPVPSPAPAATAPIHHSMQHQVARHCNCNSQQCASTMQQCAPLCNSVHNQSYCNNQYSYQEPKEEVQCGVISQSSANMRQTAYQRTLEYVEQCQNWTVTSTTPRPAPCNMVINDMTSSLNSLMEENRYFQMIQ
jgi:transcriptional activator cubitus interruptus